MIGCSDLQIDFFAADTFQFFQGMMDQRFAYSFTTMFFQNPHRIEPTAMTIVADDAGSNQFTINFYNKDKIVNLKLLINNFARLIMGRVPGKDGFP